MPILAIRRFPDPLLKQPTRLLASVHRDARHLIGQMVATMRHHPRCVGLAAPQIGSPFRLAVMDARGHPKTTSSQGLIVLVNPEILQTRGQLIHREGCLSVPDLTANVQRAEWVRLSAMDQEGRVRELVLEGFEAVIAQHEVDHLDGTLFLDRVADLRTDVFKRKRYF